MDEKGIKKLKMESHDIISENIDKIKKLFPNVVSEAGIDFDLLKQELSEDIVDGGKEKYQLTWPGKKESIREANTPTTKTLRPIKEKSVDFDNTKNIYIEGDNLEALKILQESYLGKIKCIYIDPPYNTGQDFIYRDNFRRSKEEELLEAGEIDEYNNKLVTNSDSNGRFHSDWLSMMYPRLKLVRNLLTDDGVIFISIDDKECANLKKICDEIFGERNFIANLVWQKKTQPSFLSKTISSIKEYILFYSKGNKSDICTMGGYTDKNKHIEMINISNSVDKRILKKENILIQNGKYNGKLKKGVYGSNNLGIELIEDVNVIKGKPLKDLTLKGRFKWTQSKMEQSFKNGDIYHIKNINSLRPTVEKNNNEVGIKPILDLISKKNNNQIQTNTDATNEIKDMFNGYSVMDYPKPSGLIKYLIEAVAYNKKDSIILDFFSGSATTAHAVMKLNSEDKGNRKYILIQLPEYCSKDSETYKQGYHTICDIGEERIRRAAKKIKEETNSDIDYGFRVYKVDSSNMKDVFYRPQELSQQQISLFETNIKEDRTPQDLLTQVILQLGLTLDLDIEERTILNNKVYYVDKNSLVACFDDKLNIDIIDEICKVHPLKIVFKESSFKNDTDKINAFERIKNLSKDTEVSVI